MNDMTSHHRRKDNFRKSDERELGFGTQVSQAGQRLINPDGSSNVIRKGLRNFQPINIYHTLITISWWKFNILVLTAYLFLNMVFGGIYLFLGTEQISGMNHGNRLWEFWECFFFSAQSFTTVGYGRLSPVGFEAQMLASLESLLGLLALALATGLLYGRFSRPTARILYSKNALFSPYRDIKGFMFRIANARNNQLIEVEAQLILSLITDINGKVQRTFHNLELERSRISLLTMSWTIVHPLNENSPLKNFTPEDLVQGDAEFMVMIKAIDDTYAQNVYARSSYRHEEVVWNARFEPIIGQHASGRTFVDLTKLSQYRVL